MSLFQHSVLKNHLKFLSKEKLEIAWQKFVSHFQNPIFQENRRTSKEELHKEDFLNNLFVNVFGYIKNPNASFNLTTELKNIKNAEKTDGVLLRRGNTFALIELKERNTSDLSKVEKQVFQYKNNQPNCTYVIISNFEKLRFYIDNAIDFEEFNLFTLTKERFEVLYFCLSFETLLRDDKPKQAKEESLNQEENITKVFYKEYSNFRNDVFKNIQSLNPEYDKITLFKKTQKLLDRFLFVFFAEDKSLFPAHLTKTILEKSQELVEKNEIKMLFYEKYKLYFNYLYVDKKNKLQDIFPHTGLFERDELLDNLKIDEQLLNRHIQKISLYDFDSEVSVTILGHIFEHSLNEFEEIETEKEFEKKTTKRKKEGVFYTPKYITKYIVDNTVGKLCQDKKQELGLSEELLEKNDEIEKGKSIRDKKLSQEIKSKIENYRNWLLELTICDPACGSGAFLNQALEFLINEHHYIYELELKLIGMALIDNDLENKILKNNIFGVDINEESVEIAKLSLWLHTAKKGRKLISLNDTIKCGNSLIDDKHIAGEKIFDWKKEFPSIFKNFKSKNATSGFDVIIGNPPYVSFQSDSIRSDLKLYYQNRYTTVFKIFDLFAIFIEKSEELLKSKSSFSFICPSPLLMNDSFSLLRKFIVEKFSIREITLCSDDVFSSAVVPTMIFFFTKEEEISIFTKITKTEKYDIRETHSIKHSLLVEKAEEGFNVNLSIESIKLLDKIHCDSENLGSILEIRESIKTGNDKQFIVSQKMNENYYPLVTGKEVSRYNLISSSNKFILFDEKKLSRATKLEYYTQEKLFIRRVGHKIECVFDKKNYLSTHVLYIAFLKEGKENEISLEFLMSLLNSKLFSFVYSLKFPPKGKIFPEIRIGNLRTLPIPKITKENQQPFIDLANKMLSLNEEFETKKGHFLYSLTNSELDKIPKKLDAFYELDFKGFLKELGKKKIMLSKQDKWQDYFEENKKEVSSLYNKIQVVDNQIDNLVFELYELSEEEIEIVKVQ
jgi:type I restriction-modification system DNA methylase subunit